MYMDPTAFCKSSSMLARSWSSSASIASSPRDVTEGMAEEEDWGSRECGQHNARVNVVQFTDHGLLCHIKRLVEHVVHVESPCNCQSFEVRKRKPRRYVAY